MIKSYINFHGHLRNIIVVESILLKFVYPTFLIQNFFTSIINHNK